MNLIVTVHDLTSEPCDCSHEEKWREKGATVFTVTRAVKKCLFAQSGKNL